MVFEKLEKRVIIQGTIEAVTPLHIGSGKPELDIGEVDMPILRDPSEQPYIPGSSLKGRTRSQAEAIARQKGLEVCYPPNVRNMCGSTKRGPEEFCIGCRIFGTAGNVSVASKVKFRDAYPVERVEKSLVRTGIAIDRSLGSVAERALYDVEAVPAGTKFSLEIVGENLSDEELELLKAALKSVQDSALGGGSTRGFGKVKFQFERLITRTAGYYLGQENETVLTGDALADWFK
jgi:CRISPR-associated RAMP protein (TIGR02581 family)